MDAEGRRAGTTIAGYRIEAMLGRGGMGVVYCARDLELDRLVALKVISPELVEDEAVRARFLREARAAAAVEHPHVIPIHAAGVRDDVAFIAMRLVDGEDLRRRVRRQGALPPEQAAALMDQAGAGLDAIHGAGFVHRDVKPANLLIDRTGHLYVTDFGLVKQVLTHSGATSTGQWVGTLDYVAPEQIRGGRVDARADIYALGGVLFYALTGKVPFDRAGDEAKLWAQLSEPPPAPSRYRPELPRQFDDVVARAMRKSADARYLSAGDLSRAARAAAAGGVPAEPERMVARGAAAPEGATNEPGLAPESVTASAARETVVLAPPRHARHWALPGAALVLAALAATAVVLIDREPEAGGDALSAPTATATPVARVARTTDDVGTRPSSIVHAGGDLWVVSHHDDHVRRIDAATGRLRRDAIHIGRGSQGVFADGTRVWVVATARRQVIGVDARTGKVFRRITLPERPWRVRADTSGLWVLTVPVTHHGQLLRRFDRGGRAERWRTQLRRSHSAFTLGAGSVWLAEPARQGIVRINARTGRRQDFIHVGGRARLTFGAGYVWAIVSEPDTGYRIDPAGGYRSFDAGHAPAQIAVMDGRVYISNRDENEVRVLDADSTSLLDELEVPPNPFAFAMDGRSLWVTGLAEDTVTRIVPR